MTDGGNSIDTSPPAEIGGARVYCFAVIDQDVRPTGATRHSFGTILEGELVPGPPMAPFAALAIVQYEGEDAYYLLYLDSDWEEVTDTWHQTVDAAKRQAEFEYEGITAKWIEVSPP
jgi:hypothetical protein